MTFKWDCLNIIFRYWSFFMYSGCHPLGLLKTPPRLHRYILRWQNHVKAKIARVVDKIFGFSMVKIHLLQKDLKKCTINAGGRAIFFSSVATLSKLVLGIGIAETFVGALIDYMTAHLSLAMVHLIRSWTVNWLPCNQVYKLYHVYP